MISSNSTLKKHQLNFERLPLQAVAELIDSLLDAHSRGDSIFRFTKKHEKLAKIVPDAISEILPATSINFQLEHFSRHKIVSTDSLMRLFGTIAYLVETPDVCTQQTNPTDILSQIDLYAKNMIKRAEKISIEKFFNPKLLTPTELLELKTFFLSKAKMQVDPLTAISCAPTLFATMLARDDLIAQLAQHLPPERLAFEANASLADIARERIESRTPLSRSAQKAPLPIDDDLLDVLAHKMPETYNRSKGERMSYPPLHFAAIKRLNTDSINTLIKYGANPLAYKGGATSVGVAAYTGHSQALAVYQKHGVSLRLEILEEHDPRSAGSTLLHRVVQREINNQDEVVRILCMDENSFPDLFCKDINGKTPWDLANSSCRQTIELVSVMRKEKKLLGQIVRQSAPSTSPIKLGRI